MSWTREQIMLMLDRYQLYPCLYQVKNVRYKNRRVRNDALEQIKLEILPLRPGTTIDEIKKKIGSLRSTFLYEYKKVLKSKSSNDIYIPNLFYYEKMLFLIGHAIEPSDSVEAILSESQIKSQDDVLSTRNPLTINVSAAQDYLENHWDESQSTSSVSAAGSSSAAIANIGGKKRRYETDEDEPDPLLVEALAVLKSIASSVSKPKEEITYIGSFVNYIGAKMSLIKNRVSLEMLMNKIDNDVSEAYLQDMEEE